MRKWIARFSFSFLVLAFVLGWQGYQVAQQHGERWRVNFCYLGAALCAGAGLAGTRERHRR